MFLKIALPGIALLGAISPRHAQLLDGQHQIDAKRIAPRLIASPFLCGGWDLPFGFG
jgi:hypothetical protein